MSRQRKPVDVVDKDLLLERMCTHAAGLLRDARSINGSSGSRSRPGAYLLELTALEIMLKAGVLRERGELEQHHGFVALFHGQSAQVQKDVSREFHDRELQLDETFGGTLESQLESLSQNFVRFRYVYESSRNESREEFLARQRRFVEGRSTEAEYDVVYRFTLLDILLRNLSLKLEAYL